MAGEFSPTNSVNNTRAATFIPGEGVLALDGIYVGLPAASVVTSTIFYG